MGMVLVNGSLIEVEGGGEEVSKVSLDRMLEEVEGEEMGGNVGGVRWLGIGGPRDAELDR